jgi:hypothetical protein
MEPGLIGRKYQHEGTDDKIEGRKIEVIDKPHHHHLVSAHIIPPRGDRERQEGRVDKAWISFIGYS